MNMIAPRDIKPQYGAYRMERGHLVRVFTHVLHIGKSPETPYCIKPIYSLLLVLLLLSTAPIVGAKDYAVFDVVGDSISYGINRDYPSGAYGWVHMMFGQGGGSYPAPKTSTIYTLWPGITTYNSAISSSKASDWAATPTTSLNTVLDHHPDLVVVFIGGNDFLNYCVDGSVTPEEFAEYRNSLNTILDRLQSNSPRPDIIVVDYYDLADGFSENLSGIFSLFRPLSQTTIEVNQMIHEIAAAHGTYQVSIYNDFLHHAYGEVLGDTQHLMPDYFPMPLATNFDIHPVTVGHNVIYGLIYEKLQELKQGPGASNGWIYF